MPTTSATPRRGSFAALKALGTLEKIEISFTVRSPIINHADYLLTQNLYIGQRFMVDCFSKEITSIFYKDDVFIPVHPGRLLETSEL